MMTPILFNYKISATGNYFFPIGEYNPGDVVIASLFTEAPTNVAGSLSIVPSFSLAPIIHKGLNLNSESNGLIKPYTTASYAGDVLKTCLPDGDWKTFSTAAGGDVDTRKLIVPARFSIVRFNLTVTMSGGTSPYIPVTLFVGCSTQ